MHRLDTLSFWDALIVRAAIAFACTVVYSEDMQDGRTIDGLRIVNPSVRWRRRPTSELVTAFVPTPLRGQPHVVPYGLGSLDSLTTLGPMARAV